MNLIFSVLRSPDDDDSSTGICLPTIHAAAIIICLLHSSYTLSSTLLYHNMQ